VTIVDTADLHERSCPQCGAVVVDQLLHRRWHHELSADYALAVESIERARDVAVALHGELELLIERERLRLSDG